MAGGSQYRFDGVAVEAARLDLGPQFGGRVVRGPRRAVRTRFAHRLIRVRGADESRVPGDGRAREPAGVPGAVETFAVREGDRTERSQRLGLVEHSMCQVRVEPHALPLACAERPLLVPDGIRDAEAAEIVDETGAAHGAHLGVW